MTTQPLIEEILAKNPQLTQTQLMERMETERVKSGGLLADETLLRLIAAKLGVQVPQNCFQSCSTLSSAKLFAGLYDVTIAGRIVAVFPVRTFQGELNSGKFATVMLGDHDGLLRVVLWNEKAELIEKGELKPGQAVRLLHGYTKNDRAGKPELHMSAKSLIELQPETKTEDYQPIENFTAKISSLNGSSGNVHIVGTVKAVYSKNGFHKSDNTDGIVMRLAFRDNTGEALVVVWNEKVDEIEKALRDSPRLLLVNARVKEAQGGTFEVHVDSNTYVSAQPLTK
ncbi:MAG TPA: OB-fold nucleic acid binding domain-containing protein [Candidatus Acidoferrales bacterium]|nr:OB-fold nucleic acid binding domain-containing protein [Candidatus Acidoferrales bacterium]